MFFQCKIALPTCLVLPITTATTGNMKSANSNCYNLPSSTKANGVISFVSAAAPPTEKACLEENSQSQSYRFLPSVRLLNCLLVFFGTLCNSCNFASFNFLLICMVNSTAVIQNAGSASKPVSNCPLDDDWHNSSVDVSVGRGHTRQEGDIVWSREQQANLLAAYSWSMCIFNVPMGLLVHRFGAKRLFIFGQLLAAVASFSVPSVAYMGEWWVWTVRLVAGAASGIGWPVILYTNTRWAPEKEVGMMITISAAGFPMGTMVAFFLSGMFCQLDAHGWIWGVYFIASLNIAFVLVFSFGFSEDPKTNRFITDRELAYIMATRAMGRISKSSQRLQAIPWPKILTSGAVLATMTSAFCLGWSFYLAASYIPVYMKEVLDFDTGTNGILSAFPHLCQFLGRFTFGFLSDRVSTRLGRTLSVKAFDFCALAMPCGLFVVLSFLDCRTWLMAVICFCLAQFFIAANTGGYLRSTYYIAPRYVSVISAVSGCCGSLPSILVPYIVGSITRTGSLGEWKTVFYISAAVEAVGIAFSLLLITAEEQEWAKVKNTPGTSETSNKASPIAQELMDFEINPKFTRLNSIPGGNY